MNKKLIILVLAVFGLGATALYSFSYSKVPSSIEQINLPSGNNIINNKINNGAVDNAITSQPVGGSGSQNADIKNDNAGMANPASVYCGQQGGKLEIREGKDGQAGICVMPDGAECDEWEFFRTKVCGATKEPVGGNAACGRENCHGLEIECGPNPAEMCTMEYRLGDKCLRYVNCGIVNGKCQQIQTAAFDACKSCVQQCEAEAVADPQAAFDCESKCE